MGTDISLWRVDGGSLSHVESQGMSQLEELIEKDPSVLGERVIVMGHQVRADLDLVGTYARAGEQEDEDLFEHVVPVRWLHTRAREEAIWQPGFCANQNSACRFRHAETLARLREEFSLED